MYIGSVRFFKHLILLIISLMIIIPTVGCISLYIQNNQLRAQIHELQLGDWSATEISEWNTRQLGYITVHIPSNQVTELVEIIDGVEISSFQSTSDTATVSVERFLDFVIFLQNMGVANEMIATSILEGTMTSGVADFLSEAGGEVLETSSGQIDGVRYFRSHGTTNLTHTHFEMRVFAYENDFYLVMLLWNAAEAPLDEPFFQSIRFNI